MPPLFQPPHGRRSPPPQESPPRPQSRLRRSFRRVTALIPSKAPQESPPRRQAPARRSLRRVAASITSWPPHGTPPRPQSPAQRSLRRVTASIPSLPPDESPPHRQPEPQRSLRRVKGSVASVPRGAVSVAGAAENVASTEVPRAKSELNVASKASLKATSEVDVDSNAPLRISPEENESVENLPGENERERQRRITRAIEGWLDVEPGAASSSGTQSTRPASIPIGEVSENPELKLGFSPRFGTYFSFTSVYQEGGTEVEMTVGFRSAILNRLPGIRTRIASSELSRCGPRLPNGRRRRRRGSPA